VSQLQELEAEKAAIEAKIAILESVPEDLFHFGTVVLFAATGGVKWYVVKTGEELWSKLSGGAEQDLASWVLEAVESNIGYFELYELKVEETPFYTHTP
jgi:hypothetical protein